MAGPRILVIEDDLFFQEFLHGLLTPAGFEVLLAGDGEAGFRLARESHPAAVLTDVELPGPSGLEVLYGLRSDPSTSSLPVIVMSGKTAPTMMAEHARQAGPPTGWLAKPFGKEELLAALASLGIASSPERPAPELDLEDGGEAAEVPFDPDLLAEEPPPASPPPPPPPVSPDPTGPLRQALEAALQAKREVEDQAAALREQARRKEEALRQGKEEVEAASLQMKRGLEDRLRDAERRVAEAREEARVLAMEKASLLAERTAVLERERKESGTREERLAGTAARMSSLVVELEKAREKLLAAEQANRRELDLTEKELRERERLEGEVAALRQEGERLRISTEEMVSRASSLAGENEGLRRSLARVEEVFASRGDGSAAQMETLRQALAEGLDRTYEALAGEREKGSTLEQHLRGIREELARDREEMRQEREGWLTREGELQGKVLASLASQEELLQAGNRALPLVIPPSPVMPMHTRGRRLAAVFALLLLFLLTLFTGIIAFRFLGGGPGL